MKEADMNIKVLGFGCPNCKALEDRTTEAATPLGLDGDIEKVALSGRVPKVTELESLLAAAG
jgi:hypothetical protein